jgi:hypothetical protein
VIHDMGPPVIPIIQKNAYFCLFSSRLNRYAGGA